MIHLLFQMFQTIQRLNFRLCANYISSKTQLKVKLKRQNILYKKLYSSSTENFDPEGEKDKVTVTGNKKEQKSLKKKDGEVSQPFKLKKPLDTEINPRLTRIDKRDIPVVRTTTTAEKKLVRKASDIFDIASQEGKNLETFIKAVDMYNSIEKVYKRGMVEFIEEGLKRMNEFGLQKNLDAYKVLILVFPKEELKAQTGIQVGHMYYPKQQQCAIDIMDQMESFGLIPDEEFGHMLTDIFHVDSHCVHKYSRMMYWLPKFRHANPYPVPYILPDDDIELAVLALKRAAFDVNNKIDIWKTKDVEENPIEDTFIVSAQSLEQQELIEKHPVEQPLYVEGAHTVYLRNKSQSYFVLKADPKPEKPQPKKEVDEDLFENWRLFFEDEEPTDLAPLKSIHEQDDLTILGMCITGTGSKDSLVTWIRYLQQKNHKLEQIPIVFSLKPPVTYLDEASKKTNEDEEESEGG